MADSGVKAPGKIFSLIPAMMRDVEAVGKDKENKMQNYKFRGIDEALSALNPVFVKHGVFPVIEILGEIKREVRTNTAGKQNFYSIITMKTTFYAEDGSSVFAITGGEGFDSGDKSLPKAMACAFKYALYYVFCIPTQEKKDAEDDSQEFEDPLKNHKEQMGKVVDKWVEEKWLTEEEVMDALIKCGFPDGFDSFKSKIDMDKAFVALSSEVKARKAATTQGASK